ncbi:MAG TPA: hypothetical protein VG733_18050 [Chthoniobacteraceae bacterium]|nr:hypothetical protein [Chthoniobacteraceae bacterium]
MKPRASLLIALLSALAPSFSLHAQDKDGPPVNGAAVLSALKQIKQQQQTDIKSTEATLAQNLMNEANSPGDALTYYIQAITATQFSGLGAKEPQAVMEWKKKHEAELRDPNFQQALSLHLAYLSLSVLHDSGVKTKDLLPRLLDYVQRVQANPALASQDLMIYPLPKSVIVASLGIGQYLTDNDTWELTPIKVDNIYQKVILPEYRIEKKATEIFQYWDARIQTAENTAQSLGRPLEMDKFNNVIKPALQWQRAEEYVNLGQPNNAINAMMAILKDNKYHPEASSWISEVEKLVTSTANAAPNPAPAPAPAGGAPVVANPVDPSAQN